MAIANLAGKYLIAREKHEPLQELEQVLMQAIPAGMAVAGTSDTPLPEALVQTAGAIAGGFTLGVLGKNIGARIGATLHPGALKQQRGTLAGIGRTLGQETLQQGLQQQALHTKGVIKQQLREETSAQLLNEALQSPEQFVAKYGIDAEAFKKYHGAASAAAKARATLETVENLPPKTKEKLISTAQQTIDPVFTQVEELIGSKAADSIDERLKRVAERAKNFKVDPNDPSAEMVNHLKAQVNELTGSMLGGTLNEVTGEHLGRAAGRYAGDEIGIMVGMGLGSMAAGAMNIKSDKDKKIEQLQAQLNRASY